MKTNKRWFPVCSLLLLALATGGLLAGERMRLEAEIPFDFIVSDVVFGEGQYKVRVLHLMGGGQILSLSGEGNAMLAFTRPAANAAAADAPRLVFNHYPDDQYFLSEIWIPGNRALKVKTCSREHFLVTTTYELRQVTVNLNPAEVSVSGK